MNSNGGQRMMVCVCAVQASQYDGGVTGKPAMSHSRQFISACHNALGNKKQKESSALLRLTVPTL